MLHRAIFTINRWSKASKQSRSRRVLFESLEDRRLLASDWHNASRPLDVDVDGIITPTDVLLVINEINFRTLVDGSGRLRPAGVIAPPPYIDTNGDGFLTPLDVLLPINALNSGNEPPVVQVLLANDTGAGPGGATDRITSEPRIIGSTFDPDGSIDQFLYSVDGGDFLPLGLASDGSYALDNVFALDGSDDGSRSITFRVVDNEATRSDASLTFTLDTISPAPPQFGLSVDTDDEPRGDRITGQGVAMFAGQTDAEATVTLFELGLEATTDAQGNFLFQNVPLVAGNNRYTATAVDVAGNASRYSANILRRDLGDGGIVLRESDGLVQEATQSIELALDEGTRTVSFDVMATFDEADKSSVLKDVLLVYLVDSQDTSSTILNRGMPGTTIFALSEDGPDYRPGVVAFDGTRVQINVSEASNAANGSLLFQLINGDGDVTSSVIIDDIQNIVSTESRPSLPAFPEAQPEAPGEQLDISSFTTATQSTVLINNVRLDSKSGMFKAELRLRNVGPALSRNTVALLPELPEGVSLLTVSGQDSQGVPYVSFFQAIPPGGLESGKVSGPIEIELANPSLSRFALGPVVKTAGEPSAPELSAIAPIELSPGDVFTVNLEATDADGDAIQFYLNSSGDLPGVMLTADGKLRISPRPGSEGDYEFSVVASDGLLSDHQNVSLRVTNSSSLSTSVSGVVLSTELQPLAGVPVQVGRFQDVTGSDGSFTVTIPSFLTPTEAFNIAVPSGDAEFDPLATGEKSIELRRAGFDPATGTSLSNPRLHPNQVSSFIDASVVYGSDAIRATALRKMDGTGKLKTSEGNLLPRNSTEFFPVGMLENENNSPVDPSELFVAGDVRANENIGLTALQTLLVREHNRRAEDLSTSNPGLSGEQIYQEARRWVGAILQHITYSEYLPLLVGTDVVTPYSGYSSDVVPSISGLFSGAAFRIGHSMSPGDVLRLAEDGTSLPGGPLSLTQGFFNPQPLTQDGLEPYLRGLAVQQIEQVDTLVRDELRNFLFGPPGAGGFDLVALNIQRGRDLGLPSYNQARIDFGLESVESFADISSNPDVQAALASAYASVNDIDVWVGGLAEDHVSNALIGELFQAIIADQFERMRDGDRFWYENSQFTEADLAAIRATTLQSLILQNTTIESIGDSVFTTGAVPTGPAAGGSSAASPVDTVRTLSGFGNNADQPSLGSTGTNLLIDYTLSYEDGVSSPAGSDRPNAREVSNGLFAQDQSVPNQVGATTMFMLWGQLLAHDIALTPGGTDDSIRVFGDAVEAEDKAYPFVAEKLPLMLLHPVYLGVNNEIERPIYLPELDLANADMVDPANDSLIDAPIRDMSTPAEVMVMAGSAMDRQGQMFDGMMSITEVPPSLTPVALPKNLFPDLVVTIQPANIVFTEPAMLTLPNTEGAAPGEILDLWSINPVTGEFEIVGQSQVSDDGSKIVTISGGIRTSSWHLVGPPPDEPLDLGDDPNKCNNCVADNEYNSTVELYSGAVRETHDLLTYQSLGETRGISLTYDSLRADPRHIVSVGYDNVPALAGGGGDRFRLIAKTTVSRGGFEYQVPGHPGGEFGLTGGEHFWRLPADGGDIDASMLVDLRGQPSGLYDYTIESSLRRFNGRRFTGASALSTSRIISVNSVGSPFGNGWGIAGLQALVENPGGEVLLVDGDGSELLFEPDGNGEFLPPAGDFSILSRQANGQFTRTMKNQTVYAFDAENRLSSMIDRNGNTTTYAYDDAGRLIQMTDPVGLATSLTYADGRLTLVTDPAGRETRFSYDANGNLASVTDPDGSTRRWEYDSENHMTAEVDQRGFREQTFYDFAGRTTHAVRSDGSVVRVDPVETQSLLPSHRTSDPNSAPRTFDISSRQASLVDANGNVKVSQIDNAAQQTSAFDTLGPLPTTARNELNLVTAVTGSRGHETRYEYDLRGNLIAMDDSFEGLPHSSVRSMSDEWILAQRIPFVDANSAHFNPRDGSIAVMRTGAATEGIYRVSSTGQASLLVATFNPGALVVDPDDGDIFFTEASDGRGTIYRIAFGTKNKQVWASGFHSGDDDPQGMAIAPDDYTGSVLPPGHALVVDNGFAGEDEVWRFSPDSPHGETVVHDDNGTLIGAIDVTITSSRVFMVDTGDDGSSFPALPGVIFEVGAGGTLRKILTSETILDPVGITHDPITGDLLVFDNRPGAAGARIVRVDPDSGEVTNVILGLRRSVNRSNIDMSMDGSRLLVSDAGLDQILIFDRVTSAVGRREYAYDPTFNRLAMQVDELGRTTINEIDPTNGNILSVTQVVGGLDSTSNETDDVITRYTYATHGLLDEVTDPLGRVTDYDYDALGRNTKITYAKGTSDEAFVTFEYDAAGNQVASTDENGNTTRFEYDSHNRTVRLIEADPDGDGPLESPMTTMVYDAVGNVITTLDAAGSATTMVYDSMGRMTASRDELGNMTSYQYDDSGNVIAVTDPNGNTSRSVYDARDQLVASVDPEGGVTSFTWDANGNLLSLTDPVGNVTRYRYDGRDRLVEEIDPLGASTYYEYDAVDNLVRKTDRNERVTDFVFDELDRLEMESWLAPDGTLVKQIDHEYDKVGNLLSIVDNVSSLSYEYDARDRVLSVDNTGTLPDSGLPPVVLSYTYDGVGNVTSVSESIDGAPGAVTAYEYDALNRNMTIQQSGGGANEKLVDFVYNQLGQFDQIRRYSDLGRNTLVAVSDYSYDDLNRLLSLEHGIDMDPRSIAFYDYEYDSASRISSITDIDGRTDYGYDDRDQLTEASRGEQDGRGDETYSYDTSGNRLASHLHSDLYVTGPGNRLVSDGEYEYEYDAEGNLIRRTRVDSLGYLRFEYDHRNRLVAVNDYRGEDLLQVVRFDYDSLGRRIKKAVGLGVFSSQTTYFVYDRSNVLLDFETDDGATSPVVHLVARYLHGPSIDHVISQEVVANSELRWLLRDHLGTTHSLLNDSGELLDRIEYDSFGNVLELESLDIPLRYLFTGREFDPELELYYYRTRFYNASAGIFLSEDPLRSLGGDTNLYRYVGNSPVIYLDPFGLKADLNLVPSFRKFADKLPDSDKFSVVAHGNPDTAFDYRRKRRRDRPLTAEELAELIRSNKDYEEGDPVLLLSCQTGSKPDGFAQKLADALNAVVTAPNKYVHAYTDGSYKIADKKKGGGLGKPGELKDFHPDVFKGLPL